MAKAPKPTPPASDTKTQWEIIKYERNLVAELLPLLAASDFQNREYAVRMVMAEGACVHLRNLCEVLTTDKAKKGEGIRLSKLEDPLPSKYLGLIKDLAEAFGEFGDDTKPFSNFSGRIMHADMHRGLRGEYVHHVNTLLPLINAVIALLPQEWGIKEIPLAQIPSSISTATDGGPTNIFSQRRDDSTS